MNPGDATSVTIDVSYRRVIMDVAATRDFFPAHHDPDYTRMQGNDTIYLNTMALEGLIDRIVTDWAGPTSRIARRRMAMQRPVLAGDTVRGDAVVLQSTAEGGGRRAEIEVRLANDGGVCCAATVTVELGPAPP